MIGDPYRQRAPRNTGVIHGPMRQDYSDPWMFQTKLSRKQNRRIASELRRNHTYVSQARV